MFAGKKVLKDGRKKDIERVGVMTFSGTVAKVAGKEKEKAETLGVIVRGGAESSEGSSSKLRDKASLIEEGDLLAEMKKSEKGAWITETALSSGPPGEKTFKEKSYTELRRFQGRNKRAGRGQGTALNQRTRKGGRRGARQKSAGLGRKGSGVGIAVYRRLPRNYRMKESLIDASVDITGLKEGSSEGLWMWVIPSPLS